MAKNYTFAEAVKIINEGKDLESIADIGRRYPILLHKVTKVAAVAGEDFTDLMSFMPDYLTANKINTILKNASAAETEDDDVEEEAEVKEEPKAKGKKAKAEKAAKEVEPEEDDEDDSNPYEGKSAMELFKECKKRGVKAEPKKTAKYYTDLLTKADAAENDEDDDWEEDEEVKEEPKKAKASKKAEPEKKASKKAAKKEEAEDEDDDWDI